MYIKQLIGNAILIVVFLVMSFGLGTGGALLGGLGLIMFMNKILTGDSWGRKLPDPAPGSVGFSLGRGLTILWVVVNYVIVLGTLAIVAQMGH